MFCYFLRIKAHDKRERFLRELEILDGNILVNVFKIDTKFIRKVLRDEQDNYLN
jgi:hypothetical protein